MPIALYVNALMTNGCGTGRRRIRAGRVRIQCENGRLGRLIAEPDRPLLAGRYLIASQLF